MSSANVNDNIRGTAWRQELVNTATVTVEKTNHDLEDIQSHLKPLMDTALKNQKGLMIDIVKFSGKVSLTPDIILLRLLSETLMPHVGSDVEKPHVFTFTFLRSSFYSVTVKRISTSTSTSTTSDNLPLANVVQAARSFQYLTKSLEARLHLLKTYKATLDSRLGYTWSASSVWLNDSASDLPELVDADVAVPYVLYGVPNEEEFQRLGQMMKQQVEKKKEPEEKIDLEREDDQGPYAELRRVFVVLNNTLIVVHRKLRKRYKKLYRSITLSNFETVLNQLNRLLLDITTQWEHRFSTVYSAIYIYHQKPPWNNYSGIPWLKCVNELLLEAKERNVEGVNWGFIIPLLYKYVVAHGLAYGLCQELQQGWLQPYKLRSLIGRLTDSTNNKEHQLFFRSILEQLESRCAVNKKLTGTLSCDEALQTAPLIMNEVAKLFHFLVTLQVSGKSVPLATVPFDAEELLLSLAELEQVYKGTTPLKQLKPQQVNVPTRAKAIATVRPMTPSYFQRLRNHVAAHHVAYLTLASLALTTGMSYLWNYEGGERDYCLSRSRPLPEKMDPQLNKYFSQLDNLCCAMPDNEICKRDPLLTVIYAYIHYFEKDHPLQK